MFAYFTRCFAACCDASLGHIFLPWVDISWRNYCACLIFCIASITDFFDGYIARQFDLGSTFGEVFDPLADKMLILGAFIGLLLLDRASALAVFISSYRVSFISQACAL